MKRETQSHPKLHDLAARLEVTQAHALGLLQGLIWFVGDHAPTGAVGRWPNGAIARGSGWERDPDTFVDALEAAGWLDAHPQHRLVLHDWPDHAENWVRAKLSKLGLAFCDCYLPAEPTAEGSAEPTAEPTSEQPEQSAGGSAEPTAEGSSNLTKPNRTKPNQQIPPNLQASRPFLEQWEAWLAYRKRRRLGCDPATLTAQLVEMEAAGPDKSVEAMRESIRNSWSGVWPAGKRPARPGAARFRA